EALGRPSRRRGQLHASGPAGRHHQQCDARVPAGAAKAYARTAKAYAGTAKAHGGTAAAVTLTSAQSDAELHRAMNTRPELLSIIGAVFNEVRTVRAVIDRLLTIDLPVAREVLVVDDGSTDGTADVLATAAAECGASSSRSGSDASFVLITAERNAGKG